MKKLSVLITCTVTCLFMNSCAFKLIKRKKNIVYSESRNKIPDQSLNVFYPRKTKDLKPVFIFIHGGNWDSGKKSLYSFFGNRMARKDIVSVIIDYPLSPLVQYDQMAKFCAESVKWVAENSKKYGGDPKKIYVSGHSAGGHLASLISIDSKYFDSLQIDNPVKGIILIDAAGLDMYDYLKEKHLSKGHTYLNTFSTDQNKWKDATPLSKLHTEMPKMLIFRGGKTYESIIKSNEKFVATLPKYTNRFSYKIQKGKHHVPMIIQFLNPYNPRYKDIKEFMKSSD